MVALEYLNSLAKEVDILRDEFCCNFFKISSKNSLSSNYLETNSNYLLDLQTRKNPNAPATRVVIVPP